MPNEIIFEKIRNKGIFEEDFNDLQATNNASIAFKMRNANGGIAVVYAPNGMGKTSLCNVLSMENENSEIEFSCKFGDTVICGIDKKFHVIKDQINRNVIPGDTSDYLVGADILREYELKNSINHGFQDAFADIPRLLKNDYGIKKSSDYFLQRMLDVNASRYLKNIIPSRTRGRGIDRREFVEYLKNTPLRDTNQDADERKVDFLIKDCAGAKLVEKILGLQLDCIVVNADIQVIEKSNDAILLIRKYISESACIICDNEEYNSEDILKSKEERKKQIYNSLAPTTKDILDNIINHSSLQINDPFDIKAVISNFICCGNATDILLLIADIEKHITIITDRITNMLLCCFNGTPVLNDFTEYSELQENQPVIDDDDMMFIQDVVSENIGPEISLTRDTDNDNNFKIMLGGNEFLGVDRSKLHLSSGEQNFISLAFELILARRSSREFIVIDDPISSFDSVYKNKAAFCIIKFLENKRQIVFTHNMDLVRLLEVQQNGCFNLYLLNNVHGGNNGFISVNRHEKDIIINLSKLIKLLQNKDDSLVSQIIDEKMFLIAIIPFMRGYAHISKDCNEIYVELSRIMHGYSTGTINGTEIYHKLFGFRFHGEYMITTSDVLTIDCDNISILRNDTYPLLSEALRQTIIYYHLRMKVEKELVETFNIPVTSELMLNQIILKAFSCNPNDADARKKLKYRVFFTSRKTLLNEFNHFEGNMNIFQPAIDIEPNMLCQEVHSIKQKLNEIKTEYCESI